MIAFGKQSISQRNIDAATQVLLSGFLTQDLQIPIIENKLKKTTNAKFAVAVNSAISVLDIALELKPDDLLWTSAVTFVTPANCANYCRAQVDFIDIDPPTYNICSKKLEQKLIYIKKIEKLPKFVIPVNLCQQSCDMEAINRLSLQHGVKVIQLLSSALETSL